MPTKISLLLASTLAFFSSPTFAENGNVLTCNGCTEAQAKNLAKSSGLGTHIIADFNSEIIRAFNVEYDRELRTTRALKTMIPEPITESFVFTMSLPDLVQTQIDSLSQQKDGTGAVTHVIRPDASSTSNGITFPHAYTNSNAHEIIQSATVRSSFGQNLASQVTGARTSSNLWNSLATTLNSLSLGFLQQHAGIGSINFVVIWNDGSKSVFKFDSSTSTQAEYVAGKSTDANGNPIPDASVANPENAASYAGEYYFSQPNHLDDWMRSAQQYGIPVVRTGGGSGYSRGNCSWDGQTLSCSFSQY